MAGKLIRSQWERQPVGPVGINWGHARAEGLAFFAPLSGAHGTRDLVAEQLGTRTGLEAYLPTSGAIYHQFGTGNFCNFPEVPAGITGSTPITFAWTQDPRSTTGYSTVLTFAATGVTNGFAIFLSSSDSAYFFTAGHRNAGNVASFSSSIGAVTNDRLDRFVLTVSGGVTSNTVSHYTLWRNGERFTTATASTYSASTSSVFRIGALEDGSNPFEGLIGDMRMWARVLSDGEAEEESTIQGGWALYQPQRIWVPVSAGVGGYTLTADSGSYALTGQSAGLLASRTVVAEQGSYALTGQDAALTKGANLVAGQGSYTLSGQDATLLATRRLLAEQGSYTLTGQDATLTYAPVGAYTLTANSGSYALTGQDAALRLARTLVAAQGSYALTGQDATLSSGKIMLAGQGSYTLTGQDAGFRRSYALAAGFGSYTLTGQAATLTYSAGIVAILEQVRLRSRITQAFASPSRITQQLSLRSQVRH